jgi:predicted component of viral defense system (DUF524 family)
VLRNLCGAENIKDSSILKIADDGLSFDLRKGAASKVVYEYRRQEYSATVSLFYNRTFQRNKEGTNVWDGSYSASFHPDYSVLIEVQSNSEIEARRHWLHFDAKYRLDIKKWKAELANAPEEIEAEIEQSLDLQSKALDEDQKDTFKRGDLYKMHTYRDALLGSRGAYILFPGTGEIEEVFIRYPGSRYPLAPFYFPSVGAFQLRPFELKNQSNLEVFLSSALEQIIKSEEYVEEAGFFRLTVGS